MKNLTESMRDLLDKTMTPGIVKEDSGRYIYINGHEEGYGSGTSFTFITEEEYNEILKMVTTTDYDDDERPMDGDVEDIEIGQVINTEEDFYLKVRIQ